MAIRRISKSKTDHTSGTLKTKPKLRSDGEMYARPKPDPFSHDWCDGYDAGVAGKDGYLGLRDPFNYWDGFKAGQQEREELDRSGSSNA